MRQDAGIRVQGFTLVEMAVVMVVIGLIMMTILPAMTAFRSGSQRALTTTNLQALMRATASYVQANGCLPCPTPAATSGAGFGHVRGDSSAGASACGACASAGGLAPYASLGLPITMARDGWGHWISMRVDTALTGGANFTPVVPPAAPCQCSDFVQSASLPAGCTAATIGTVATPTCAILNASQKGLCRAGLSKTTRMTVNTPTQSSAADPQAAAVIFVSHGISGFGAYAAGPKLSPNNGQQLPFPNPIACTAVGGFAECNATGVTTSGIFYNADAVTGGKDPYDDMMEFADRNTLVSYFGNGSCQTVW